MWKFPKRHFAAPQAFALLLPVYRFLAARTCRASSVLPWSNVASGSVYSVCLCFSLRCVFFPPRRSKQTNQSLSRFTNNLRITCNYPSIHFVCPDERQSSDGVATTKQNTACDAGGPGFVRVPAVWANGWKKNYSSACSQPLQDVCFAIAYLWLKTEPEATTTASPSDLLLNISNQSLKEREKRKMNGLG